MQGRITAGPHHKVLDIALFCHEDQLPGDRGSVGHCNNQLLNKDVATLGTQTVTMQRTVTCLHAHYTSSQQGVGCLLKLMQGLLHHSCVQYMCKPVRMAANMSCKPTGSACS